MSTKETDKDSSKRDTSLLTEKDLRQFKRLLSLIKGSGLEEVSIKLGDLSIRARRSGSRFSARRIESVDTSEALSAPLVSSFSPKEEVVSASHAHFKAPMVGTFYLAQNPQSEPFVKVGDKVEKGQTIGIIEAMKLFNNIEADFSGRIVEILVENATAVEYDQPLFLVDTEK